MNHFPQQSNICISTVNVGAYMIGEMNVCWGDIYKERYQICEKLIQKNLENEVQIICTQEDILVSDSAADGSCKVEFFELYENYGYFPLSQCILHNNTSKTLEKLHPNKHVKLGNVIYIHNSQVYNVLPVPQIYPTAACIAYCMINNCLKLANVHLCGGRFDDQNVFQDDITYTEKLKQIRSITSCSIICGDFNSTRYYGKAGGLKDWEYPIFLSKSLIFRPINSPIKHNSTNTKTNNHYRLTLDEKMKWETWQCAPIEYLYSHPLIPYKSILNDEELKNISETTMRGKYVVDWFFIDSNITQCIKKRVVKLYGDTVSPLSDHHMILGNLLLNTSN